MRLIGHPEGGVSITVSVITVVFNGVGMIEGTLKSVLGQNYPNIEYIVIDGASSDGTTQIIGQYANRLARFISEPDDGVYDAMNKGISAATGEFILFMNCGDVFASEDAVTSAMQHAQSGHDQLLFGRWRRFYNAGASLECRPNISKGLFNHQRLQPKYSYGMANILALRV
jgi:glycosyltransferase involved in cell wall biosynthesis